MEGMKPQQPQMNTSLNDEQFKDLYKAFKEVINDVVNAFDKICKTIKKMVKSLIQWLISRPGYKRYIKRFQLTYYESISKGKSNNWRKIHGLRLIRNSC